MRLRWTDISDLYCIKFFMNLKHVNGFSSIKVHQNDVQHALLVSAVTITVGSTFFLMDRLQSSLGSSELSHKLHNFAVNNQVKLNCEFHIICKLSTDLVWLTLKLRYGLA